jgi:DNA (cytosine-5)-methyltransferase 1
MTVYYNEIDPFAAQWLRNLISVGFIADGEVDERSIIDVKPSDLAGFTQCHFFAGIGVWSYALRLAGWPDDRPVWTASCPCQPFSAAGKRGGVEDERHLWPEVARLVRECGPVALFGEQVASKDGLAWLDTVHADLEAEGYAVGALDTCAAGFGAPHIRQRLYFVADAGSQPARRGLRGPGEGTGAAGERAPDQPERPSDPCDAGSGVASGELADAAQCAEQRGEPQPSERPVARGNGEVLAGELADPDGRDASAEGLQRSREHGQQPQDRGAGGPDALAHAGSEGPQEQRGRRDEPEGLTAASFWSAADWLACIDGKARPVEPGTFPLAHGIAGRVGRLRAYGNCIVAPQAAEFIRAYMSL